MYISVIYSNTFTERLQESILFLFEKEALTLLRAPIYCMEMLVLSVDFINV